MKEQPHQPEGIPPTILAVPGVVDLAELAD